MTLFEIIVMNFFTASSVPLLVVLIFNIRISDLKLEKGYRSGNVTKLI